MTKALYAICFVAAAYFGLGFVLSVGWPPATAKDHWLLLAMFVLFALVPFVKEIDLFQLVSIKRDIKEVKSEVGDAKEKVAEVRDDMRQILNSQQTLMSSVHTMAVTSANQKVEQHFHYEKPPVQVQEEAVKQIQDTKAEPITADLAAEIGVTLEADARLETIARVDADEKPKFTERGILHAKVIKHRKIIDGLLRKLIDESPGFMRSVDADLKWQWLVATSIVEEFKQFNASFAVFSDISAAVSHNQTVDIPSLRNADFIGAHLTTLIAGEIKQRRDS